MNLFEFQLLKHSATGQSFSEDSSDFQTALHDLAGGFLVLIERVGVDVQRGGGLAVAEDARHRGHIRAARDHQAMQKATTTFNKVGRCLSLMLIRFYLCNRKP